LSLLDRLCRNIYRLSISICRCRVKKYEDKIAYWVSEKDNGIYDAMGAVSG